MRVYELLKKIIERLGVAYMVEEGSTTVGGVKWHYEKWSNGTARCWAWWEDSIAKGGFTTWGTAYYKDGERKNYPFTFVEVPTVQMLVQNSAVWMYASGGRSTTQTPNPCYLRPNQSNSVITPTVYVYAIGRWK